MANELIAIATHPGQLAAAQEGILAWCSRKLAEIDQTIADLQADVDMATKRKWKVSSYKGMLNRQKNMQKYYGKIVAAVQAGYYMVPNFPVDIFAIRTNRARPASEQCTNRWERFQQDSESPAIGVGHTVDAMPIVFQHEEHAPTQQDPNKHVTHYYPQEFDEVDLPVTMLKPQVLEAFDRAQALKIFDEYGVLPHRRQKGDPLVTGVIKGPGNKRCQFMIAWWLDENSL